ncbi:MAG TPA: hypothetical protein VGW40_04255 [Allosphingosinicella sp.]|nr:hypothetical protein [Allosphingosinicella sp.]
MKLHHASLSVLLLFASALPASGQPARQGEQTASDDVPAATAQRARNVAERSAQLRGFLAEARTIFIGVDIIRRKAGDRELTPLYRVQHYRYADDTVITSVVDLEAGRVGEQVATRNVPVRLTEGEFAEARALALADRRVTAAVGQYRERLVVEPLLVRTLDRSDPWFGRRIVRLLFRVGTNYMSRPLVYVDLTGRQVIIEEGHGPREGDRQ